MDTTALANALRNLDVTEYTWKFALYSTQKTRDGLELEWNLCDMNDIDGQIALMRDFLLKKPIADKPVMPYTPFLSDKENIGALEITNELISEQIADIFLNIENGQIYPPNDFISGSMNKVAGYAFYGKRTVADDEQNEPVLFMRRGNPFLTGAKFYIGTDNEIVPNATPLLKFTTAVDFMAFGGVCYFLSSSIEKDFSFEDRHFAIAQKCLDKIAEAEIVGDYDGFEQTVMTPKNARKFLNFDTEILDHIVRQPITERIDYLEKYGIEVDRNGRMDTYEKVQSELIIDLLCSRSCLNPLGRLSIVNNLTPRD